MADALTHQSHGVHPLKIHGEMEHADQEGAGQTVAFQEFKLLDADLPLCRPSGVETRDTHSTCGPLRKVAAAI